MSKGVQSERLGYPDNEYSGLTEEERQRLYALQAQLGAIRRLADDSSDVRQEVTMLERRKDALEISISECRQLIEELRDNIRRYGEDAEEADVLSISRDHSEVEQNIRDIRKGIEAENAKLAELKANKDRVASAIDKMAGGTDYRLASRKYEICDHVFRIFEKSKTRYRERLKENVEKDATDLFVQLTGDKDYVGLQINDNYGLEIIHKSGRKVPGRSSGYEHIVALSLISCIGILTAIQKHSDSVEGLFPSYASMWMVQTLGREMPEYPQNVRVPVHYKDYTTPILKRAEKKVGDTPWAGSSFDEFYRLLHSDLSCDSANAQRIASIFYPAESIEEMLEDPEEEMLLSDADELMEDRLIDEYGREEYSKQVRQCVDSLTDREREVLYLRYGLGGNSGKSLQEVGDYYGLTRERVRQIEVKAERHLLQLLLRRHLIERDHYKALPKKYKRQYKKHSN